VQINYIGGPKAIPTFEQPNALRAGVVDMANTTSSFTAGLVPDGLALNYTTLTQAEMRKNGIFEQINTSYADKGLYYYARTGEGIPYHLYLNKKIDSADLSGLKIRVAPIYRDFLQKQNATVVQMAPGEVFTALERGVVDGYAWPLVGIFDLGWADKTKFRVDPGFYAIELGVVFNLASWNKLDARQKAYLQKQAEWLEAQNVEMGKVDGPADAKRQADAGIQVIKLDEAQSKIFLKAAYDGGWEQIIKASPVKGPKLRELMAPK
jgi:TRAP-type C4-dicarboxylate transport system substrate-binding protein